MGEKIKNLSDSVLWSVLADVSIILSSNRHKDDTQTTRFWLELGDEIKKELDKRLLFNYEND